MDKKTDMLMVGYDYLHGDIPVLIVGRRLSNHTVDIVEMFQGTEAIELYNKLTKKGEKHA